MVYNSKYRSKFYNKNDKVRITDLHQGIVWGTQTTETILHEDLINRFDYDGIFGTVLNRFIVESQIDHPILNSNPLH